MATVTPYLLFDGDCAEALEFYAAVFGGEVSVQRFADSPVNVPADKQNHVMHGEMRAGDLTLMATDGMGEEPRIDNSNTVSLSVAPSTVDEGGAIFDQLAAGGMVLMKYEKQFWGDTFGMVADRYGIRWMVNAQAQ